MRLFVNLIEYHQEVHHLIGEFFPNEMIVATKEAEDIDISVSIDFEDENIILKHKGQVYRRKLDPIDKLSGVFINSDRNRVKMAIYKILQEISPTNLPWGSFTGVHPSKIIRRMKREGYPLSLLKTYDLSDENIILLDNIYETQENIIKDINGLSLYIHIPFCPSRCSYCSFPTMVNLGLIGEYLDLLEEEIRILSPHIPIKFDSIYIGGGTPTVLSYSELERLFMLLEKYFDLSEIREYTLEAGRPDTLDDKKLKLIEEYGIDRISINPQSMHDKTLKAIGRNHSAKDIREAFKKIKSYEIKTINCDLIFGLKGEGEEEMRYSLSETIKLNPKNITIHTLSVKKGANMEIDLSKSEDVKKMIREARDILGDKGYHPYYLYRQKNMIGSLENIGYSKEGNEGLYNILMMDELSPILSIGMGGISKFFKEDKIERVADFRQWDVYKNRREEKIREKINYLGGIRCMRS